MGAGGTVGGSLHKHRRKNIEVYQIYHKQLAGRTAKERLSPQDSGEGPQL